MFFKTLHGKVSLTNTFQNCIMKRLLVSELLLKFWYDLWEFQTKFTNTLHKKIVTAYFCAEAHFTHIWSFPFRFSNEEIQHFAIEFFAGKTFIEIWRRKERLNSRNIKTARRLSIRITTDVSLKYFQKFVIQMRTTLLANLLNIKFPMLQNKFESSDICCLVAAWTVRQLYGHLTLLTLRRGQSPLAAYLLKRKRHKWTYAYAGSQVTGTFQVTVRLMSLQRELGRVPLRNFNPYTMPMVYP